MAKQVETIPTAPLWYTVTVYSTLTPLISPYFTKKCSLDDIHNLYHVTWSHYTSTV